MLNKILRKRIKVELDAWENVRHLMPRGRKTRGIQYETLEYLFERLYERVSEQELAEHLRRVKGQLQSTGDPVKGAINQAVKELQRIPDRPFQIIKIQETTISGVHRYVQMNYTRFEEVIGFPIYSEYLQEVLHKEEGVVVRGVGRVDVAADVIFPGLNIDDLNDCTAHFLVNPSGLVVGDHIKLGFISDSPAMSHFLLIYEDESMHQPFLGFLAHAINSGQHEDLEFIMYRGSEKSSKLAFLDRTWRDLEKVSLNSDEMAGVREKAIQMAGQIDPKDGELTRLLLDGLCRKP